MSDNDREDVLEFIAEARDYFDDIEPKLLKVQNDGEPISPELIDSAFRTFHSVKGVAGFLSFSVVQSVTHKVEEALDLVRSGKLEMGSDLLSLVMQACDFLRTLLQQIETTNSDTGYEDKQKEIEDTLMNFLGAGTDSSTASSSTSSTSFSGEVNSFILNTFMDLDVQQKAGNELASIVASIEDNIMEYLAAPNNFDPVTEMCYKLQKVQYNTQFLGLQDSATLSKATHDTLLYCQTQKVVLQSETLSTIFDALNHTKNDLTVAPISPTALEEILQRLEDIQNDVITSSKKSNDKENEEATEAENTTTAKTNKKEASSTPAPQKKQEMKVDVEKLDKLVRLIEEVGMAKNILTIPHDSPEYSMERFNQASISFKTLTTNLQDVAISIRMNPIGNLFKKMYRLVHDISSKLGKKVQLQVLGESTEMDKNDMESLQDPLVHILRNAMDHGLEDPETRVNNGKEETGLITLKAWHSSGEVLIEIADNGRGINKEVVFNKAVEKGIITPDAKLTTQEIYSLIMAPGFSTAAEVTNISGRGVGMDVVKQNIEMLKGRLDVNSTPGKGSTFTIHIPMDSSLVDGMLVRVGKWIYTIRIAFIRESFRPSYQDLTMTPDGKEYIKLRNKLHRLIRLYELHEIDGGVTTIEDGLVILVESKGQCFALFVDEILGKVQTVIKPLPEYFSKLQGVSGCSIIGTGTDDISWALDINHIIDSCIVENKSYQPS